MSDEAKKTYRVLRDSTEGAEGQLQVRDGDGWSYPKKGDLVELTDASGAWLCGTGHVEVADGAPAPTPPRPKKPRVVREKKAVE